MVTIFGRGWRVLALFSMAMFRVAAFFFIRIRVDVGFRSLGCMCEEGD